jgi:hypothetical protein
MIVLPLAKRVALCVLMNLWASGRSSGFSSQTVSFLGLTSRVRISFSSVISVLPFFRRIAAQGLRIWYFQISLKC